MVYKDMLNKKSLFLIIFSLSLYSLNSMAQQKENIIEKEQSADFVPFYSLRFEIAGGGSNLKYQNKTTTAITSSNSKKLMNFNIKWVSLFSKNWRWYAGAYFEDYSFQNINSSNELSLSPAIGITYSVTDNFHVTGELMGYQHLEMNALGNMYRKMDPALKLDWKFDLINFADRDVIGIGQYYGATVPLSGASNDPYNSNAQPDYDVSTQLFYRNVYLKNTLEFYINHQYRVLDSAYYRLEMNNMLIGLRFALPFQ